jgi:hypothetical protein
MNCNETVVIGLILKEARVAESLRQSLSLSTLVIAGDEHPVTLAFSSTGPAPHVSSS